MTTNNLVFVPEDGTIGLNGEFFLGIEKQYFDWVPENVHAFHWYSEENAGEIEFKVTSPIGGTKPPNEIITELGEWAQLFDLFDEEKSRREEQVRVQQELEEAARDYWQEFRNIRDYKLLQSDWTQLADAPVSSEQKQLWEIYRQELRDLPGIIEDPKPMVVSHFTGEIHPDWPVPPPINFY
jgi:hypothetical protein